MVFSKDRSLCYAKLLVNLVLLSHANNFRRFRYAPIGRDMQAHSRLLRSLLKIRLSQKRYRRNTPTPRNPPAPSGGVSTGPVKTGESSFATPAPSARLQPHYHNTPPRALGRHYSDFDRAGGNTLRAPTPPRPKPRRKYCNKLQHDAFVSVRLSVKVTKPL